MSRYFVDSVNIVNMHNVTIQTFKFNPKFNYLIGPNGAGKSTVLQAVQLGLLGYIPGSPKKNDGIFRHASAGQMGIVVTLRTDDGKAVQVTRHWTAKKTTVSSDCTIIPEGLKLSDIIGSLELPIFNFNELLGKSANQMKDWFISFLPKMETKYEWAELLTEAAAKARINVIDEELIPSIVRTIESFGSTGIDQVRQANEYLKQLLSFKNSEQTRMNSTIQSLIHYDDVVVEETPEELVARLQALQKERDQLQDWAHKIASNENIRRQLDELHLGSGQPDEDPNYAATKKRMIESRTARDEAQSSLAELTKKMAAVNQELQQMNPILSGKGLCPYTSQKCEALKDTYAEYVEKQKELNGKVVEIRQQMDAVSKAYDHHRQNENDLTWEMIALERKYSQRDALLTQLVEVPQLDYRPADKIADIDKEIMHIQDLRAKVEANNRYNKMIDTLTADKFKIEQTILAIKEWISFTGVNGLQSSSDAAAPFIVLADMISARLSKYLNRPVKAKFNIEERANSFSFGIENDMGGYIPFDVLSSGEKCLYTLAMMVSLIESTDAPLRLVIVDDLLDHLDNVNIDNLFKAMLEEENIQIIFAGVKDTNVVDATNGRIEING